MEDFSLGFDLHDSSEYRNSIKSGTYTCSIVDVAKVPTKATNMLAPNQQEHNLVFTWQVISDANKGFKFKEFLAIWKRPTNDKAQTALRIAKGNLAKTAEVIGVSTAEVSKNPRALCDKPISLKLEVINDGQFDNVNVKARNTYDRFANQGEEEAKPAERDYHEQTQQQQPADLGSDAPPF